MAFFLLKIPRGELPEGQEGQRPSNKNNKFSKPRKFPLAPPNGFA